MAKKDKVNNSNNNKKKGNNTNSSPTYAPKSPIVTNNDIEDMIKNSLIHINTYATFCSTKLSASALDNSYTIGPEDVTLIEGEPDIKWTSIVFIKDKGCIWTHGKLYVAGESSPVVDSTLSPASTNPISNSAVTSAISNAIRFAKLAECDDVNLDASPASGNVYLLLDSGIIDNEDPSDSFAVSSGDSVEWLGNKWIKVNELSPLLVTMTTDMYDSLTKINDNTIYLLK